MRKGFILKCKIYCSASSIEDLKYLDRNSNIFLQKLNQLKLRLTITHIYLSEWIVPQMFKLLPKRRIFFDLVIRFITNRKYALFCIC